MGDSSRGRGVQSYIDPLANPDDGSISLQEYRVGSIPTQQRCEDVLKRWFKWHELNTEKYKITYVHRYLAMQTIARLTRQKISRNG
jgi:hypothetical protein